MVQRAACSIEANTFPNGVRIGDGRTSDVVATEASVDVHEGRGSARFSLFKWFKRSGNRDATVDKRRKTIHRFRDNDEPPDSTSSSVESVDTFYSTTTVRSFAFHTGTLGRCDGISLDILRQAAEVGPFAAGASKLTAANKENLADVACTLPAIAHSHRRDLTARYSLQPTTFNSCGNLPLPERRSLRRLDDRRGNCNGSARRRVHVQGKRRAPNPPESSTKVIEVDARETPRNSSRRKRRAPKPPERVVDGESSEEKREPRLTDGGMNVESRKDTEDRQTISNDTLVLQGGVLLSKREIKQSSKKDASTDTVLQDSPTTVGTLSTAMPRPWYKRSVFEHSRDSGQSKRGDVLRGSTTSTVEAKEESAVNMAASANYSVDASLSRLGFFHRGSQSEDRKREAKRKSGLSILTNISELDKEAAAIVQEEQARARASMLLKSSRFVDAFEKRNEMNEEIVQDIVTSAMENSSPRRGTRALISKFNAISNITKVTVNANFFAKNAREQQPSKFERDVVRNARAPEHADWKDHMKSSVQPGAGQSGHVEKDISRYFLPQQKTTKSKHENPEMDVKLPGSRIVREQNDRLAAETSSRISYLQSQLTANRMNDPPRKDAASTVTGEKIRSKQEVSERKTKTDNEDTRGYLFSRGRGSTKGGERAINIIRGPRRPDRQHLDGVQKEFSDIFEEIDKQLRMKEFKFIDRRVAGRMNATATNQRSKVHEEEAGISSKVTKVLDILVEAEKDAKTKSDAQAEKSIPVENASRSSDSKTKSSKTRSPLLNTVEDPITTDLKEMLKEMKHSLPKRSKPGRIVARSTDVAEKVNTERETPGKTTYFVSAVTKVENIALQNDYEADRQKVSCSVQTSGNVRRLNQPSTSGEQPSTSGWKQENVLYKTSGKSLGGSGLKNTFQLIRPRDFAEIEATKTTRTGYSENTYANVIEQSLYANAHVPPSPKQRIPSRTDDPPKVNNTSTTTNAAPMIELKLIANEDAVGGSEEEENSTDKNMNTLAINRLLRKLEAAIASGHHQQAAGLAKELARLKIHCSVIRQRSARLKDHLIKVNMYIEDKLAHQGPIPLQLPSRMTVAELKTKIHTEFEIPTNVQRWIVGKNLADRDGATLTELQAVDGSPIFLYLVAPELKPENVIQVDKPNNAERVPNVRNEEAAASAEPLQTVAEDHEVLEEPQETEEERITPEDVKMDRYEELISLENCDVIPNSESIECPVCLVTYGPREGVILRDCLHMFCRSCIANTIRYCEEAEVRCPYRDSEYTCESTLQEREIKALVEPEVYQQHLAKSIAQAENNAGNNAFHCKTPDCPGWCIYDDDVNNFLCPVCRANNCLTCQVIHAGKNCKQYQQELRLSKETDQESRRTAAMLEEMVDRGEALACPTCAVVLMKKWGCDWLRCSMCKTEICWVTRGPRWGPGGKGDTSGGCRCGENGVKCHPRCNYCH